MMAKQILSLCFSILIQAGVTAAQAQLAPHKDKLFSYPRILEQSPEGAYRLVEYNRDRDMIKRDSIPRRKVHHKYVDQSVRWSRRVRTYNSVNGKFKYFSVGKPNSATKVVVIYVHGKGGNHRQGVNDWTFGGNFNRLQNLMNRNNGVLWTPSFSDFKDKGTTDIATLVSIAIRQSPRAKIIIACGSMGGGVCWRLANNNATAQHIDGLFLLGSHWSDDFIRSSTIKKSTRNIPIVIGHGGKDPVFPPESQKKFFTQVLKTNPTYPIRFVMFQSGSHGTPIRMIDWRQELNWMLSGK